MLTKLLITWESRCCAKGVEVETPLMAMEKGK